MFRACFAACLSTLVLCAAAAPAFAVTMPRPALPPQAPPGASLTAVTDNGVCNVNTSGHFAQASGIGPFTWSVVPSAAAQLVPIGDGTLCRFMPNRAWAQQNGYTYFTLVVKDVDQSEASKQIYPITLDLMEAPTNDRIVHNRGPNLLSRDVTVRVAGQVPVFWLSMHGWPVRTSTKVGKGKFQATAFDQSPVVVFPAGCLPSTEPDPDFGAWYFTPPGGVTSSWDPPSGDFGTTHWIEIEGTETSTFLDDIELDIGIYQGPTPLFCSDGIGARMTYTVVEYSLEFDGMTEAALDDPGVYLFREAETNVTSPATCIVTTVDPEDPAWEARPYEVQVQAMDGPYPYTTPSTRFYMREPGGTGGSAQGHFFKVNSELGLDADLELWPWNDAVSQSHADARARTRLVVPSGGGGVTEMGETTTRHHASVTVVEFTIDSPLMTQGTPSTPGETGAGGAAGDEYSFSSGLPPTLEVEFRVSTLPDDDDVNANLIDRMLCSFDDIDGSNKSWRDADGFLVFNDGEWREMVTFEDMPSDITDFGGKNASISFRNPGPAIARHVETGRIEVFFQPTAVNNPGGELPNWFYYYRQVDGSSCQYDENHNGIALAYVPAADTGDGDDSNIYFTPRVPGAIFNGEEVGSLNRLAPTAEITNYHTNGGWVELAGGLRAFLIILHHERYHSNHHVAAGSGDDTDEDASTVYWEDRYGLVSDGESSDDLDSWDSSRVYRDSAVVTTLPDSEAIAYWRMSEVVDTVDASDDWARTGEKWGQE